MLPTFEGLKSLIFILFRDNSHLKHLHKHLSFRLQNLKQIHLYLQLKILVPLIQFQIVISVLVKHVVEHVSTMKFVLNALVLLLMFSMRI